MPENTSPDGSGTQDSPFVVVGLGASAGGLEALEAFFAGLPKTDSCAFVVVIHLAPERESEMAAILGRVVPLPTIQVSEHVQVEKGHVYVIPPNRNLHMEDGHLWLTPLESERRERRPIDYFFRTLAGAWGDHAVAVVLSGTGHNGTVGVRAVKEAGGVILAQSPEDAEYDEMPRSAIASGVVDLAGPAGALAAEAIAYADRLRTVHLPTGDPGSLPHDDVRAVQRVLAVLHTRTGHDFAHYKRSTVLRRLERRLHVVGAATLDAYADHLRRNPDEARELLQDLLISVTNFFRDPAAFAAFEREVIPRLFEGKGPDDAVRVWVVGCATGEEAYSVAILLAEHAATLTAPPSVQVFGTDLSEAAVRVAREGVYAESIEADVSPERLARFFRHEARGYRVTQALREAVVFAPHNLLSDPPFSHLDLVTCRNVLIYFQRVLQQQALELFHYALEPGGYLFLGTSETSDTAQDAYVAVDKANRIYQRREGGVQAALPVARVARGRAVRPVPVPRIVDDRPAGPSPASSFADVHQRLRAVAAPPSVLVTESHKVVHVSEGAGAFLQVAVGEPTRSVLRLVRPELRVGVQTALFQASQQSEAVVTGPTRLDVGGASRDVFVRVQAAAEGDLFQVLFDAMPVPPGDGSGDGIPDDARLAALAAEHQQMREQLQVSIEGFETSREELQAQNEELQSTNEELRSTAEELETSKEEAQSMAEELLTVNDEMKASIGELAQSKGDLENLIVSTEIATLFLDRKLQIKWFTPQVRALFHVRSSDIGRPLADLAPKFGDALLVEDAEAVLDRLQMLEREVRGQDGRWYLVHVRPYRTTTDHIDGVIVTFVDITERHRQEEALRESDERFRGLVDQGIAGVVFMGLDGRILTANARFCEIVGRAAETDLVGTPMEAITHPDDLPQEAPLFARLVGEGTPFQIEKRYVRPDGTVVVVDNTVAPVRDAAGQPRSIVALSVDVTERQRAEAALRANEALFDATLSTISDFAYTFDRDGRFVFVNRPLLDLWGLAMEDAVGKTFHELPYPDDLADRLHAQVREVVETGRGLTDETAYTSPTGEEGYYEYIFQPLVGGDGAVTLVVGSTRDVTGRKRAESKARAEARRAAFRADLADALRLLADPADVQAEATRALGRHLGATRVHYAEADDEGLLVVSSDYHDGVPSVAGTYVIDDFGPAVAAAYRAGQTLAVADVAAEGTLTADERAAYDILHLQAYVGVPVVKEGQLVGLFVVHQSVPRAWTPEEVALIEDTAERTWSAVERRRAEAAIHESERRFRALTSTTSDVLYRMSPDWSEMRHLDGGGFLADTEASRRAWRDGYIHPDDREAVDAAIAEAVRTRGVFELEHRVLRADGTVGWTFSRAIPLLDDQDEVAEWFGAASDVTERNRAEAEVRALNATLEARVAERTAEVRQLAARLTVAEQEERQRIAHVLHDDLQQQLYGLSVTLSLLVREPLSEAASALARKAIGTTGEATAMARSLATELSPAILLSDRLRDVLDWFAKAERVKHGLEIEVDVRDDPHVADPALRILLYQLLRELLFNVVKHSGVTAARLTAHADGDHAVVRVEDDGAGFEMAAVGEGRPGGFGMSSVRERLALVGGRFEVESAPGRGTRITLYVPAGAVAPV